MIVQYEIRHNCQPSEMDLEYFITHAIFSNRHGDNLHLEQKIDRVASFAAGLAELLIQKGLVSKDELQKLLPEAERIIGFSNEYNGGMA